MKTLGPHNKGICEEEQTPVAACNLCLKKQQDYIPVHSESSGQEETECWVLYN